MSNEIIRFLCQRSSSPRLGEPAPAKQALEQIFQCAFRAPDHMMLHPWRYLVIEGEARAALGEVFVQAARVSGKEADAPLDSFKIDKLRAMPLRAPMMIIAIASPVVHPKVPELEQILSTGVAVGYMLVALQALGFGGIWRTGEMADHPVVAEKLGLSGHERIVGFLYAGTPVGEVKSPSSLSLEQYVTSWKG
jgi:nitroreductase